jgi:penicillin-binding protein 1A
MYNPYINAKANKERQELILDEMYSQGYISKEEMEEAKTQKLVFVKGVDGTKNDVIYSWYVEAVIEDVITDLAELKDISRQAAESLLSPRGIRFTAASISTAEQARQHLQGLGRDPQGHRLQQAVAVRHRARQPVYRRILALEGGIGEKTANRLLNRATQTRRPPGFVH